MINWLLLSLLAYCRPIKQVLLFHQLDTSSRSLMDLGCWRPYIDIHWNIQKYWQECAKTKENSHVCLWFINLQSLRGFSLCLDYRKAISGALSGEKVATSEHSKRNWELHILWTWVVLSFMVLEIYQDAQ